jgi:hypothetical protein
MKLDAVMLLITLLAVAMAGASVISLYRPIPYISDHAYWVMTGAFGILIVGLLFKSR